MDQAERTRLKQLANDSIIATFGRETNEARLAQALEQCVDELEDANAECPTCSVCEDHGDLEDESIDVDINELLRIHKELSTRVVAFKDLHGKFDNADEVAVSELINELALQVEELGGEVDELEAEITL